MELTGYRIEAPIFTSKRSQVFRAVRESTGERAIVKVPLDAYPSLRTIAGFERAFAIGKKAESPGVVAHLELVRYRNGWALVTADIGASALDRFIRPGGMPMPQFFDIAIKLSRAVADVHAAGIIHKDIKPANVIVNEASGLVQIIDFGIASQLDRELVSAEAPDLLEGTLLYMSPEQTGRMNRGVDYRSDLYSLGATLYEMSTGVTPFSAEDPIEILHGHIARVPRAPHEIRPDFPQQVSDVVMRLLAKSAEDRFASAMGVVHDLERASAEWKSTGRCSRFALGQRDVSPRFRIPEKLYGRESDIAVLMDAFDRTASGERVLLTVVGQSGIGKTSLVREVQRPIAARRGYFCSGKFEQFRRDIPYFALVQAVRDLVSQVLTEPPATVDSLRARVLDAVGHVGRVLTDVVPDLELLIGAQPPIVAVAPSEAQSRFNRTFLSFVRVFAHRDHPLVLFVDDLQWADAASLALVELLATSADLGHLLVIGGYRDNEVGPGHVLKQSLQRIEAEHGTVQRRLLTPLDVPTVTQIVSDTLSTDRDGAQAIASLVHTKTAGNPFFVLEFLRAMHSRGHVTFDVALGAWRYDLARLRELDITDNVVDLVTEKLKQLPASTIDVLCTAACLGAEFELNSLAMVSKLAPRQVALELSAAMQIGVIQPLSASYKYVESLAVTEAKADDHDDEATQVRYRFQHDRVQQAADDLLEDSDRAARHLNIGRMLLAHTATEDRRAVLIELVDHLNKGLSLISSADEKLELARLNHEAGAVASDSLAFGAARRYLEIAASLLPENAWKAHFELSLSLYTKLAEAIAREGDHEAFRKIDDLVAAHARSELDRVTLHIIRQRQLVGEARFVESLEDSLRVIAKFGVKLPRHPRMPHILAQVATTEYAVYGKQASEYLSLPAVNDPTAKAAIELLGASASAVYFAEQNLMPLVGMTMVRLSIKHGIAEWSSYGFALYAFVLAGALGRIDRGYEFGQLAAELGRRTGGANSPRTSFVVDTFVRHWKERPRELTKCLLDDWSKALDHGDEETATYCAGVAMYTDFFGGSDLPALVDRHADAVTFLERCRQVHVRDGFLAWADLLELLTTPGDPPETLTWRRFSLPEKLPGYEKANNGVVIALSSLAAGILDHIFGRFDSAHDHLVRAFKNEESILSQVVVPGLAYMLAMNALTAALAPTTRHSRDDLVGIAKKQLKRLKTWQRFAPFNQTARVQLIEAMLADVAGNTGAALEGYFRSLDSARDLGLLDEEAMATERAADFARRRNMATLSADLTDRSIELYRVWGATRKVVWMQRSLALTEGSDGMATTATNSEGHPSTRQINRTQTTARASQVDSVSMNTSIAEIDLLSIMKSSQAISGSLVLEDLIKRLLQSLLENAAAQRGFLILKGDTELVVEATTDTAGNGIVMHETPVEARDDLSRSIVRYVERTKERVVLKDASHAGQFQTDPYVVRARPKSVLCMPIVRQQKLIGVLYLENNLATDVFTAKRCRTLDLLSVQAAISLENARLYDTLEGRVKERTQQLKDSFDRVERTQAALDAELRDAATYVRSLLPAPLTTGTVRSDWRYVPSAHLGGDALGYSYLEDGRFTFYVIDVAGHGLASALLSISILTALHGRHLAGADYGDPGSVLKALNDAFPRSTNGGRHFTMWYGVLDPKTRSLTCSNGGHPSAVICGADGTRREAGEVGIMLGILPALDFTSERVELREGDRIYVFSDGAYEIQTKTGSMLDYEQFADQLVSATTNPAERVAPMLSFATTTSGGPLEDDFTMLCVELATAPKRLFALVRVLSVASPHAGFSDGPHIGVATLHLDEWA